MKLWLIFQKTNTGYDTYDSAVVAAPTEAEASMIHPGGSDEWDGKGWGKCETLEGHYWGDRYWAPPDKVTVKEIGVAKDPDFRGVVCASFNAG